MSSKIVKEEKAVEAETMHDYAAAAAAADALATATLAPPPPAPTQLAAEDLQEASSKIVEEEEIVDAEKTDEAGFELKI